MTTCVNGRIMDKQNFLCLCYARLYYIITVERFDHKDACYFSYNF